VFVIPCGASPTCLRRARVPRPQTRTTGPAQGRSDPGTSKKKPPECDSMQVAEREPRTPAARQPASIISLVHRERFVKNQVSLGAFAIRRSNPLRARSARTSTFHGGLGRTSGTTNGGTGSIPFHESNRPDSLAAASPRVANTHREDNRMIAPARRQAPVTKREQAPALHNRALWSAVACHRSASGRKVIEARTSVKIPSLARSLRPTPALPWPMAQSKARCSR
jgi:hypothetical protein